MKGESIPDTVERFRSNPDKYLAIHFQSNIIEEGWSVKVHQYTLIPHGIERDTNQYRLKRHRFPNVVDQYFAMIHIKNNTNMTRKLSIKSNKSGTVDISTRPTIKYR